MQFSWVEDAEETLALLDWRKRVDGERKSRLTKSKARQDLSTWNDYHLKYRKVWRKEDFSGSQFLKRSLNSQNYEDRNNWLASDHRWHPSGRMRSLYGFFAKRTSRREGKLLSIKLRGITIFSKVLYWSLIFLVTHIFLINI